MTERLLDAPRERREPRPVITRPVTLGRSVRSEWIKFRTLRSTWAVLGGAVVGLIGIGLVVAHNTAHLSANLQPDDVVGSSTLQGYYLGQLLIGALGVLFVSGEYSTGAIRSTLTAVPRRVPVLWAKAIVFTAVVLVTTVVASFVAFLAAQALISGTRPGFSLSDPGVLRVVTGTGVYLTLIGLIGAALGWIVRNTPGALVSYFALVLVVPVLLGNVLGTWGRDVSHYLPSVAGGSFVSSVAEPGALHPWPGLLVLVVWVVALTGLAAVRLRRRDA